MRTCPEGSLLSARMKAQAVVGVVFGCDPRWARMVHKRVLTHTHNRDRSDTLSSITGVLKDREISSRNINHPFRIFPPWDVLSSLGDRQFHAFPSQQEYRNTCSGRRRKTIAATPLHRITERVPLYSTASPSEGGSDCTMHLRPCSSLGST